MKIIVIGQKSYFLLVLATLLFAVYECNGQSPDDWKSRTIYQLLTDRFARNDSSTDDCSDLSDYCGGSFQGILNHLDYIQGMGFDAIWISPIPANTPGGYHGYWMQDMNQINPQFGTADDLHQLVDECHKRDMFVMLDVVNNHVGPVGYDYSSIVPFNNAGHYHNCGPCPSGCQISDFNNQPQVEWCRLSGLPDLNQANNFVSQTLQDWVKDVISNYSFDGLRLDTCPEVPKTFWSDYVDAAGIYAVGEVYNGGVKYVSSYQAPNGPLPGVLSYPLFFTMRNVFASQQSMWNLHNLNTQYAASMGDLGLLGTFIDNHDQERFLSVQQDIQLYKSAITYTMMSTGIPIIYYGTEQSFSGGNDPDNREALWTSNYDNTNEIYKFIRTLIDFRRNFQIFEEEQVERYVNDKFFAFTRGNYFIAVTNGGSDQDSIQETITYHPYSEGQKLCNVFWPNADCISVENNKFTIVLLKGESKIYYPVDPIQENIVIN